MSDKVRDLPESCKGLTWFTAPKWATEPWRPKSLVILIGYLMDYSIRSAAAPFTVIGLLLLTYIAADGRESVESESGIGHKVQVVY